MLVWVQKAFRISEQKKRMWEYVDLLRRTSSNFCAIMAKALKIASVAPVMVTILSGDDPSDMLMRAPL